MTDMTDFFAKKLSVRVYAREGFLVEKIQHQQLRAERLVSAGAVCYLGLLYAFKKFRWS